MKQTAILLLFISCLSISCSKDATKYRELLNNAEIVYPGPVNNFKAFPGNLRIKLQWNPSPDPSITKYIIYWNNSTDSLVLEASNTNTSDSISTGITGLEEYVQNFVLYTIDGKGNKSIGQSLSGVRIYGPLYGSSLINRPLDANRPPKVENNSTYTIYFSATDTLLNINTSISYLDSLQQPRTVQVDAKTDSAVLDLALAGTKVTMLSSYVPVYRAIDTFDVKYSDTLVLE